MRAGAIAAGVALCGSVAIPAGANAERSSARADGSVRAQSGGGVRAQNDAQAQAHASASLEGCVAAGATADGTATFAAHMTALPGTAQMEIRFEILERDPGEASFHRPSGSGNGAAGNWRVSGEHVTVFKDFDEVVGLAGPALFRARVRFRWLDAEGTAIDWAEHKTEACKQPPQVSPTTA